MSSQNKLKIKLIFGLMLLLFGLLINFFSANYIDYKDLDNINRNPDIILNQIDYPHPNVMIVLEIVIIFSFFLFVWINRKEKENLINALILLGLFSVLRGLFLPLTILGGLQGEGLLKGFTISNTGLFPSGHIAYPLIFLFNTKKFKLLFFVALIFVGYGLLVSQQHYTIDIFSSIIFIYAINSFMEKNIK